VFFAFASGEPGARATINVGFVESGPAGWTFRPTDAFATDSAVTDNLAAVYDSGAEEWMLGFAPSNYSFMFAARYNLDGARIAGPIGLLSGAGDGTTGPHNGIELVQNRSTGRFLIHVSHNAVRFQSSGSTILVAANDGTLHPGDVPNSFDPFGQDAADPLARGKTWATAAAYANGSEFRSGGSVRLDPGVGRSVVVTPAGLPYAVASEGTLWSPPALGSVDLHVYAAVPESEMFVAIAVRETPGTESRGNLILAHIDDGPMPEDA
jgi:hypothetical protein